MEDVLPLPQPGATSSIPKEALQQLTAYLERVDWKLSPYIASIGDTEAMETKGPTFRLPKHEYLGALSEREIGIIFLEPSEKLSERVDLSDNSITSKLKFLNGLRQTYVNHGALLHWLIDVLLFSKPDTPMTLSNTATLAHLNQLTVEKTLTVYENMPISHTEISFDCLWVRDTPCSVVEMFRLLAECAKYGAGFVLHCQVSRHPRLALAWGLLLALLNSCLAPLDKLVQGLIFSAPDTPHLHWERSMGVEEVSKEQDAIGSVKLTRLSVFTRSSDLGAHVHLMLESVEVHSGTGLLLDTVLTQEKRLNVALVPESAWPRMLDALQQEKQRVNATSLELLYDQSMTHLLESAAQREGPTNGGAVRLVLLPYRTLKEGLQLAQRFETQPCSRLYIWGEKVSAVWEVIHITRFKEVRVNHPALESGGCAEDLLHLHRLVEGHLYPPGYEEDDEEENESTQDGEEEGAVARVVKKKISTTVAPFVSVLNGAPFLEEEYNLVARAHDAMLKWSSVSWEVRLERLVTVFKHLASSWPTSFEEVLRKNGKVSLTTSRSTNISMCSHFGVVLLCLHLGEGTQTSPSTSAKSSSKVSLEDVDGDDDDDDDDDNSEQITSLLVALLNCLLHGNAVIVCLFGSASNRLNALKSLPFKKDTVDPALFQLRRFESESESYSFLQSVLRSPHVAAACGYNSLATSRCSSALWFSIMSATRAPFWFFEDKYLESGLCPSPFACHSWFCKARSVTLSFGESFC